MKMQADKTMGKKVSQVWGFSSCAYCVFLRDCESFSHWLKPCPHEGEGHSVCDEGAGHQGGPLCTSLVQARWKTT